MRSPRRLAAAALVALSLLASPASADDGVVRFQVAFTEVRDGPNGSFPLRRSVAVSLRGGREIVAVEERGGGRRNHRTESGSAFGQEYQQYSDRGRMAEWRVEGKDTLVRRSKGRTDTEILAIKSLDASSCKAGVGFVLLPGQTMYFRRNGWFSSIRAEDVTCEVYRGG